MSETLREALTRQALEYMRGEYKDALATFCPENWEPERIEKLVEMQLDHSRHILDAIGIHELQNTAALEHHVGQSIVELRARVHHEVAAHRRKDTR
jgi:hypothetical protein